MINQPHAHIVAHGRILINLIMKQKCTKYITVWLQNVLSYLLERKIKFL